MKTFKKIDLYIKREMQDGTRAFKYVCSTNQSKTCKEAKRKFCEEYGFLEENAKAKFAKE